ncbi:MAG: thrombospondin type 3 repeat-containing protein [Chitinophagales bacterium]|nr:thrombospondin type 3 repeat-containing protein [Chitinophagales bacterium]
MNSQKSTWSLSAALLIVTAFCLSSADTSAKGFYFPIAYVTHGATDTDGDGVSDKKDKCPDTPKGVAVSKTGCPLDADKDGVVDYLDKCPRTIGTVAMNGCPDTDKDGVSDFDDKCINVPGIARFKGCPDSDEDGIEDAEDRCPNAKGLDRFKGCPDTDGDGVEDGMDKCPGSEMGIIVDATGCSADQDRDGIIDSDDKCPDTEKGIKVDARGCPSDVDGDGIVDSKDKCPTTKGEGTTNGCPEVKVIVVKRLQTIARGINFESDKAALKTASYPMLDEIVSILKEYPDYNLKMGGHTDNVGEDQYNIDLSQARMDGVKSYLVSKGIPLIRIEATGYGERKPLVSNNTAEGRMQNRRVELELVLQS